MTDTPTETPPVSETPTETPTSTLEASPTPTETLAATETPTDIPTETPTELPTPTDTPDPCATAPVAPALGAPPDSDTLPRLRVLLRWSAVDCAASYHLIIVERGSGQVVVDESGITDLEYRTPALEAGRRYLWHVLAVNPYGETASEEWMFRINPTAGQ
jgi:hypothetical protein